MHWSKAYLASGERGELVAQLGADSIAHYWRHVAVRPESHEEDVEYKVAMLLHTTANGKPSKC